MGEQSSNFGRILGNSGNVWWNLSRFVSCYITTIIYIIYIQENYLSKCNNNTRTYFMHIATSYNSCPYSQHQSLNGQENQENQDSGIFGRFNKIWGTWGILHV